MTVTGVTVYTNDYSSVLATAAPGFSYQNVLVAVTGTPTLPLSVSVTGAKDGWGTALTGAGSAATAALCPLTTLDIGPTIQSDPAVPSLLWVDNTNAFTVECEGSDIWSNDDGFNFLYQPMTGDFDVVVRQENQGHTSQYAKGGLMVREDLTFRQPRMEHPQRAGDLGQHCSAGRQRGWRQYNRMHLPLDRAERRGLG